MAAKSFGTPRTIVSSVVSRHAIGSNHIWKTSSGKSSLKSHLTVSQRLGDRDKVGMERAEGGVLFTPLRRRRSHVDLSLIHASCQQRNSCPVICGKMG